MADLFIFWFFIFDHSLLPYFHVYISTLFLMQNMFYCRRVQYIRPAFIVKPSHNLFLLISLIVSEMKQDKLT